MSINADDIRVKPKLVINVASCIIAMIFITLLFLFSIALLTTFAEAWICWTYAMIGVISIGHIANTLDRVFVFLRDVRPS